MNITGGVHLVVTVMFKELTLVSIARCKVLVDCCAVSVT